MKTSTGHVKFNMVNTTHLRAQSLQLCPTLCKPLELSRLLCPWDSLGKHTKVGYHALFQEIFLTQGSNPYFLCFLHWQVVSLSLVPSAKPINMAVLSKVIYRVIQHPTVFLQK